MPRGPDHPYGKTMLKHYKEMQCPLRCIDSYPTLQDQERRFSRLGWEAIEARSLWQIWSDSREISARKRMEVQRIEPFDEWEDFALFASHWFFLMTARNGRSQKSQELQTCHDITVLESLQPTQDQEQGLRFRKTSDAARCPPRCHGALYRVEEGVFEHYGGSDGRSRLRTTDTYTSNGLAKPESPSRHLMVEARQFHTVTTINSRFDCLLVGGRTAPGRALSDCWLRQNGAWKLVEPLPQPLYRHSAVALHSFVDHSPVVVFGGKTSNEDVSNAWHMWEYGKGWRTLETGSPGPKRFGATIISPTLSSVTKLITNDFQSYPWGILVGGLTEDGTVSSNPLLWAIKGSQILLEGLPTASKEAETLSRFGARIAETTSSLTVVGGLTPLGLPNRDVIRCFTSLGSEGPSKLSASSSLSEESEVPLLVGHAIAWDGSLLTIVGGGAVCFPRGTYMNSTTWSIHNENEALAHSWRLLPRDLDLLTKEPHTNRLPSQKSTTRIEECQQAPAFGDPPRQTWKDFSKPLSLQVEESRPFVIEHADFGSCTDTWTTQYLKSNLGDQFLEVHESEGEHMKFYHKNFRISRKKPKEFIDGIIKGNHEYFRAISLLNRRGAANFHQDFADLAQDFSMPDGFGISPNMVHSSVLRISGRVNMWLHYDVSAGRLVTTASDELRITRR